MTELVVTTGAMRCAKPQSECHHQETNMRLFLQVGCPSCRSTNSVKAWKGLTVTVVMILLCRHCCCTAI